ncbi:hypothetical protein C8R44DRAFT_795102 [Mycena epipterygia]|nr:hypothetical protein C8R44DRAFT_795102 [Mycena epipterygia]
MAAYTPALDGTPGAIEIGTVVGTFLFGILTLQTFNYYRQFPQDLMPLKIIIAIVWFLELGHTICCQQAIYIMTVTFYGAPPSEHILHQPQSLIAAILFSGIIDSMVQIFFGHRIRVLSGRPHFFLLLIVLAMTRLACDIVVACGYWVKKLNIEALDYKEHWLVITATTLSPVCDGFIALAMFYCLWKVRNSEFTRTRRIVDTLMIWTFETALVTSLAGIAEIILFVTRKDLSFAAFFLVQPKLFSNSMLAVLNGRSRFHLSETTIPSLPLDFGSTKHHVEEGNHIPPDIVSRVRDVRSVVVDISPIPEAYNDHERDAISSKAVIYPPALDTNGS